MNVGETWLKFSFHKVQRKLLKISIPDRTLLTMTARKKASILNLLHRPIDLTDSINSTLSRSTQFIVMVSLHMKN